MKHLDRPKEVPTVLMTKGVAETKKNKELYDNTPDEKRADLDFSFKESIYRHKTIKDKLVEIQKNTCCYCETSLVSCTGDVEHYRPKTRYKQSKEDKGFHKPGYFWLAYDWNNLLVACKNCNSKYKIDYFPVSDSQKRLTPKGEDNTDEHPLILNPYELKDEEISSHLGFKGAEEYGKTIEGGATVKYCGLDNPILTDDRNKMYSKLQRKKETIEVYRHKYGDAVAKDMEEDLKNDIRNYLKEGEYTLMIRCNFKEYIDDNL